LSFRTEWNEGEITHLIPMHYTVFTKRVRPPACGRQVRRYALWT